MADAPHSLAVLLDYAKTVITLVSALLALLLTFSTSVASLSAWLLGLILGSLIVCGVCSILVIAGVFAEARNAQGGAAATSPGTPAPQRRGIPTRGVANASYMFLIVAIVLMAAGAFLNQPQESSLEEMILRSRALASIASSTPPRELYLAGVEFVDSDGSYEIAIHQRGGGALWMFKFNEGGRLLEMR
ncbi:MAG: hypothetical protein AAGK09_10805 [Planctomycetota bacterium]